MPGRTHPVEAVGRHAALQMLQPRPSILGAIDALAIDAQAPIGIVQRGFAELVGAPPLLNGAIAGQTEGQGIAGGAMPTGPRRWRLPR